MRAVVALGCLLAAVLPPSLPAATTKSPPARGIIISTHGNGTDWDSPQMGPTMSDIREVGADWVSVHPYAWIRGDGEVRFHRFDPASPPEYLTHPIREAHALGLKILIKPHLGYWGSRFSWRGEIAFEDEAEWDRFFTDYEEWIVSVAAACADADGFVVGTELDKTLEHDARWRQIIARVRGVTDAPLTYAANWTDYRRVGFWDELDQIGIQAYFPVSQTPNPDAAELREGWREIMKTMREFSREHGRPVWFTELGYNRSFNAAAEPWAYAVDGEEAEPFQALCLGAALAAVEEEPSVTGVFLWKWFPNPRPVGRNFQLATPQIKRVISQSWTRGD